MLYTFALVGIKHLDLQICNDSSVDSQHAPALPLQLEISFAQGPVVAVSAHLALTQACDLDVRLMRLSIDIITRASFGCLYHTVGVHLLA